MTVGDKIKKIRTFRGMTQKELGLAIGFEEKGADNRIAQYETNYRVPKRELLDKMAEAARTSIRFNLAVPRTSCGHSSGWTRTALALSACSNLSAIRAEQGPLMIPLYGTMIAMTGPHTLPWVCTSSMALWTSSCGNGFFVSRSYTPGRSPGKSILNGNSTGPIPATMAWKANIISLGGKINKTSKKTALLNLSFSRAVLLVLLGFFS